jgi:hypothetical protein
MRVDHGNRTTVITWLFLAPLILLASAVSTCSQTFLEDYELVKQIKLLQSDASQILALLAHDSLDLGANSSRFYRNDSVIEIDYTIGDCSAETTSAFISGTDWNVAKGKVAEVRLRPKDPLGLERVGTDLKTFRKEKLYRHHKSYIIFHDKRNGLAIAAHGEVVDEIILFPRESQHHLLCNIPEVRKFYAGSKWRRYPEHKKNIVDFNFPAHVRGLEVNGVVGQRGVFSLVTTATDPENDVLTYKYFVSGGKIIGSGSKVVWDLSGAENGSYTVTTAVDDGCGFCGKYLKKSVTIP